jgi:hypothetical protein
MTTYGNSDFDMFAAQVPGSLFQRTSSAYVEVSAAETYVASDSEASALSYPCMPQTMITGQRVSHQVHHQPHCRRRVSFCSSAPLSEDLDQDSTLIDACSRRRVTFLSSLTSLSEDLVEDSSVSSLFCVSSAPLSEDLDQDSTVNEACSRRRISLLSSSTLSEDLDEDSSLFCDGGACCRPGWCTGHWRSRYEKPAAQ